MLHQILCTIYVTTHKGRNQLVTHRKYCDAMGVQKLTERNLSKRLTTNKPKISLSHTRTVTCRTGNTTGNHRTVHKLRTAQFTPPPFSCGFMWTLLCHHHLSSISTFYVDSPFNFVFHFFLRVSDTSSPFQQTHWHIPLTFIKWFCVCPT